MFQAIKILCVAKYQSYSKCVSVCKCFEDEECIYGQVGSLKGKMAFSTF